MVLMSLLVVLDLAFKGFLVLAKDPQTPKGGLRRGKEGRIAFLLPHFPLLKNPPPFDPPPRIIPIARRPQNRSGIRNSLTRSDLVLGRLLV
jgi:hypothetical protein